MKKFSLDLSPAERALVVGGPSSNRPLRKPGPVVHSSDEWIATDPQLVNVGKPEETKVQIFGRVLMDLDPRWECNGHPQAFVCAAFIQPSTRVSDEAEMQYREGKVTFTGRMELDYKAMMAVSLAFQAAR